ncbi:hypothetical protein GCM10011490_27560 [Pseudoclavibacter endophyticus]|uniref:PH domain-containing protein n=1 Tax=Pseudoclavibacter endophyticus TaxID=1778590 RepID=A0A6H9WAG5_9MICO|nr:hypothetical protein [Pseudoclavibacter endophyticus]KAB1646817.1 hypothetical protein F8O04_13870 [Pseudoclavibacter endophyticus]GGA75283.1 hypothetical protein GCM10011490_27560 [Pseudoclavibacter endophyticus]
MSVVAGRVLIVLSGLLLLLGAIWTAAGFHAAGWTFRGFPQDGFFGATMGFALALLVLGGVVLVVSVPLVGMYVEADMRADGVVLRRVFGRPLSIPVGAIDEIVLLTNLRVPSRSGPVRTPRVILRGGERTLAAYTPRTRFGVAQYLEPLGVEPTVVTDALTPEAAHRLCRGSVSLMERLLTPLALGAVVVGFIALVWVLVTAF